MSVRLSLEVFEAVDAGTDGSLHTDTALEEARLAAFEAGYSAGWEDAVSATANDQTRIHADLARNLQSMSFSYHEARGHILRAIEPLLRDMVGKILPEVARHSLAPMVIEAMRPMATSLATTPVTVMLNPATRAVVEPLLNQDAGMPFRFVEEPSLGEAQVYLRLGDSEQQIDLGGVIAAITAAVDSFFHIEYEVKLYG